MQAVAAFCKNSSHRFTLTKLYFNIYERDSQEKSAEDFSSAEKND
jgi:hypothetical protein